MYKYDTEQEFIEAALAHIYTRREAESYLDLTSSAMQHHLRQENIKPVKDYGRGNGKVQLFWKSDLDRLQTDYIKY